MLLTPIWKKAQSSYMQIAECLSSLNAPVKDEEVNIDLIEKVNNTFNSSLGRWKEYRPQSELKSIVNLLPVANLQEWRLNCDIV